MIMNENDRVELREMGVMPGFWLEDVKIKLLFGQHEKLVFISLFYRLYQT